MVQLLLPIIYISFISLGLPDSLLGSAWPSMYPALGVPVSYAGLISMIISFGTIVSSLNSDRLTRALGTGKVTALSVAMTAAALFGFSVSTQFWMLCLWAVPYGLGAGSVDAALNNAFGQRQVSTIYEEKNQYRVVLEYALPWLEGEDSLGKVWLPGKEGAVPLLGVAEVSPAFAPLSVAHQGQFAAVTLSFNLAEGASLSQAQAAIDEARVRIGMPSTIVGSFQGTAKMYSDTVREQVLLILAALAALYIVLGVLYESLIHPLTILSTLPSAGIGALLALRACGMEFSVIALIGVLLLCGIVKKNAIMMIDFAIEAARTRNLPPREAIHEACRLRFRPIMMTTAAAILGAVPLALGQGDGAEIRQPLGITIVGGLLVSQLLTLYTTPVVYLCLDRARLRWRRRWWRLRYGERKAALLTALCRQG